MRTSSDGMAALSRSTQVGCTYSTMYDPRTSAAPRGMLSPMMSSGVDVVVEDKLSAVELDQLSINHSLRLIFIQR